MLDAGVKADVFGIDAARSRANIVDLPRRWRSPDNREDIKNIAVARNAGRANSFR